LVRVVVGMLGDHFHAYHGYFKGRVRARLRDHRFWMFLSGVGALVLTATLLMTLPQQFQPTTDSDTSRLNIELVPGATIEQSEAVADQVTQIVKAQPEVGRILENIREGSGTLFIVLKSDRDTTSSK